MKETFFNVFNFMAQPKGSLYCSILMRMADQVDYVCKAVQVKQKHSKNNKKLSSICQSFCICRMILCWQEATTG